MRQEDSIKKNSNELHRCHYKQCNEDACMNKAEWYIQFHDGYTHYFCEDHHILKDLCEKDCIKCDDNMVFIFINLDHTQPFCNRHDHPE